MAMTVVGVFDSNDQATRVRDEVLASGISHDAVNIGPAAADETGAATTASSEAHHGGFFAWLSSLFSSDDDEDNHRYAGYASEAVRRGGCVVTVEVEEAGEAERVERIMQDAGAVDVDQRAEEWKSRGWTGYNPEAPRLSDDELAEERRYAEQPGNRIPVVKEDLQVGKREVVRGGVRVVTRVVQRPVEDQVTLREEHAHVERRPVDRPATEADLQGIKEGAIEVTERAEEAVVGKTARVVEEIEVGKETTQRRETVRDNVRETQVDVEQMAAQTPRDPGTRQTTGGTGAGAAQPTGTDVPPQGSPTTRRKPGQQG